MGGPIGKQMIPKTGFRLGVKTSVASDYFGSGAIQMNFKSHLQVDILLSLSDLAPPLMNGDRHRLHFRLKIRTKDELNELAGPIF
jgi:hypothetical protein